MEKVLLRVAEAVEVTGLSRSKLYGLVASGDIPSIRVGRAIRVPVDGLRQWVERRTAESVVETAQSGRVE